MSRPRVFITGMQHSGTSWCASLFAKAGCDLGTELFAETERQGYEWQPAREAIADATVRMGGRVRPDCPYWWRIDPSRYEEVRREVEPHFAVMAWPEVVKIPGAFVSCFWDLIDPGDVVLVIRDPERWARSMQTNVYIRKAIALTDRPAQYRAAIGDILKSLNGRPHTIVDFERAAADVDYAYAQLGSLVRFTRRDFIDLHARVTRPDWVGMNARLTGV